jgi:hypothetical protein
MLWERAGCKPVSQGVIQSRTTPFNLFVLSDLAVDIPFCISEE